MWVEDIRQRGPFGNGRLSFTVAMVARMSMAWVVSRANARFRTGAIVAKLSLMGLMICVFGRPAQTRASNGPTMSSPAKRTDAGRGWTRAAASRALGRGLGDALGGLASGEAGTSGGTQPTYVRVIHRRNHAHCALSPTH